MAKHVLITGATSGIGRELAKIFAKEGYHLILVARYIDELEATSKELSVAHGTTCHMVAKDLFEPMAAEELYDEIKKNGWTVDILVNDAGQGVYGQFAVTELEDELNIIQLNIIALVTLTKLYLKEMVARNDGKILQLASMVSKISSPLMAVYAGTKAFVYNFTLSLVNELKDTNVTVTALQPGATDTDFFNKAGADQIKIVQDGSLADPADVAKDGYDALMRGDSHVVSGMKNKVQAAMANIMPDEVLAARMRQMNEEK